MSFWGHEFRWAAWAVTSPFSVGPQLVMDRKRQNFRDLLGVLGTGTEVRYLELIGAFSLGDCPAKIAFVPQLWPIPERQPYQLGSCGHRDVVPPGSLWNSAQSKAGRIGFLFGFKTSTTSIMYKTVFPEQYLGDTRKFHWRKVITAWSAYCSHGLLSPPSPGDLRPGPTSVCRTCCNSNPVKNLE